MLLTVYQHTRFDQRRRAVNAAPGLFIPSTPSRKRSRKKTASLNCPILIYHAENIEERTHT